MIVMHNETAKKEFRIHRPLGYFEHWCSTRHNQKAYLNVCTGTTYDLPQSIASQDGGGTPSLLKPLLYGSLSRTLHKHPMLSATILDDDPHAHSSIRKSNPPVFAALKTVDLDRIVKFRGVKVGSRRAGREEVESVLEEEHGIEFDWRDKSLPLWRLVVLTIEYPPGSSGSNNEVVFLWTANHCMMDGTSGLAFHYALVEGLRASTSQPPSPPSNLVTLPSDFTILAPLEKLMSVRPSYSRILHETSKALLSPFLPSTILGYLGLDTKKFWAGQAAASLDRWKVRSKIIEIDVDVFRKFKAEVKRKRSTVHSVIMIITRAAFLKVFGTEGKAGNKEIRILASTPVTIRANLDPPIPKTEIGIFIAATSHYSLSDDLTPFWEAADQFRKTLDESSGSRKEALEDMGMIGYMDVDDVIKGKIEKATNSTEEENWGRSLSYEVSNLGVWNPPPFPTPASTETTTTAATGAPTEEWIPKSAFFSQSTGVFGEAVDFCIATVGDVMTVVMDWQNVCIDEKAMAEVLVSIEEGVRRVAEGKVGEGCRLGDVWG